MMIEKATMQDIEQLTQLRLAYLMEDYGELNENEQEIVACAWLLVVEKPMSPAFINGKTGTVLNVYTKPKHRCKGYGKQVMNMLLQDAVNMELSVVELKATEAGYSLYQSIGFKDVVSSYHQMEWRCFTNT